MAGSGYPIQSNGPSMVTATLGDNDPEVGTLKRFSTGLYRFVHNGGTTAAVGHGMVVSGVSGYTATVSSTASLMAGGIGVVKNEAIPTDNYGWVLVEGFATAESANAVSKGEGLTLGADGQFENASGLTGSISGKAMAAIASGASGAADFSFAGV